MSLYMCLARKPKEVIEPGNRSNIVIFLGVALADDDTVVGFDFFCLSAFPLNL